MLISTAKDLPEYQITEVPGWFNPIDAMVFSAINTLQCERGVRGDLMEIGVYEGRSAILLGLLAGQNERLVVCDLFEEPAPELTPENQEERAVWYPGLRRELFEAHCRRFLGSLPEIIAAPSSTLDPDELAGRFRFLHLDASHTYRAVHQDIGIVRAALGPGGVVAFDDWSQPHAPGVALAIWEEFLRGDLILLCITDFKLYATWDPNGLAPTDLDAWAEREPGVTATYAHRLAAHDVRRYTPSAPAPESEVDATGIEPNSVASSTGEPPSDAEPLPDLEPLPQAQPRWRRIVRALAPPITLDAYRWLRRSRLRMP